MELGGNAPDQSLEISDELVRAYEAADYVVETHQGDAKIRIGARLDEGSPLQVNGRHLAIITAWNPYSRTLEERENQLRQVALVAAVEARNRDWLPARGVDPSGQWPPEASVAVFNATNAELDDWMEAFGQNAVVVVTDGECAELRLHPRAAKRVEQVASADAMQATEVCNDPTTSTATLPAPVIHLLIGVDPEPGRFDSGENGYPYLVVRLMAAVYQREALAVKQGNPYAMVKHWGSYLSHPGVSADGKTIDTAAREYFEAAVLQMVQRTGFRMSIVWAKDECSFMEKDGSIERKLAPPSGGINAVIDYTRPPVSQLDDFQVRLRRDLESKIKESLQTGALPLSDELGVAIDVGHTETGSFFDKRQYQEVSSLAEGLAVIETGIEAAIAAFVREVGKAEMGLREGALIDDGSGTYLIAQIVSKVPDVEEDTMMPAAGISVTWDHGERAIKKYALLEGQEWDDLFSSN